MQENITVIVPILLVFYYPDNTVIIKKEVVVESEIEGGGLAIGLLNQLARTKKVPFQQILQSYAHDLILKKYDTVVLQQIVRQVEEKTNGKVRTELKINGDVTIKQ